MEMTWTVVCHSVFDSILLPGGSNLVDHTMPWCRREIVLMEGKKKEMYCNGHQLFMSFICILRRCVSGAFGRITLIHSTRNNPKKCELGSNTSPLDFIADDGGAFSIVVA